MLIDEITKIKEKGFKVIKIILPWFVAEELKKEAIGDTYKGEDQGFLIGEYEGIPCESDLYANKPRYIIERED